MKRSILFTLLFAFVFSLSAQRLNSRGEKMVSHISNKICYKTGAPRYKILSVPYDIYFYYDSNDEINKVKAIFPAEDTDSIVITKRKNGIIWKDYHKKDSDPEWRFTHKVFLDDEGRVSIVESKMNGPRPFHVWRRTYRYHDKTNKNKDVCLDVEKQRVIQPANGPEYGEEYDAIVYRGYQMINYDGGLEKDGFHRNIKTDEFEVGFAPTLPQSRTTIDHGFPNETNVELNAILIFDTQHVYNEESDCLLLLSRWVPIKGDFLPLEFWTGWSTPSLYYTDCIYNRNGDLTNIHVYVNDKSSLWYEEMIENIEIEYVQ